MKMSRMLLNNVMSTKVREGLKICNFCLKIHKNVKYQSFHTHRALGKHKTDGIVDDSSVQQKEYGYFYRVLESLPKDRSLAFAYGSGVFKQAGKAWTRNSMSDFIIATDDPVKWHKENLRMNPSHYPAILRLLGGDVISQLQTDYGANIYFNTLIPFEDGLIKYGVISTKHLVSDLLDWDTLYVAGRLHKPVNILEYDQQNLELMEGLTSNLNSALYTALLQLPHRCEERELYLKLAGISYLGDLRMMVGEDKNKVVNIVDAQMQLFKQLYSNRLQNVSEYVHIDNGFLVHDASEERRHYHMSVLPKCLQMMIVNDWNKDSKERDVEEVMYLAARDPYLSTQSIRKGIGEIVKRSSTPQAIKGLVTAGPVKATVYSMAKLKKMFKSMQK